MPTQQYKYQFEKNKPKGRCPSCGKDKVFRYYEGVPRDFGKCERENNCGYHHKPDTTIEPRELPQPVVKPQIYVDATKVDLWSEDLSSNFHQWAMSLGVTAEHLKKWGIGTDKGQTVFIHRNRLKEVWTAKFIQYTEGGSRDKERLGYYIKSPKEGKYHVCLFGENLLTDKRVCIVESEKTAVIASFFYPNFDFVATGSCHGLTEEKVGVLVGKICLNLMDADIAGRQKGSIQKRLQQWNITHQNLDLFPKNDDGYDLADAIRDGLKPDIETIAFQTRTVILDKVPGESKSDDDDWDVKDRKEFLRAILPEGVDVDTTAEYGFYEYRNCYWMQRKEGAFEKVSNFVMKVRFLIVGVNPKRIVEITNIHKKTVVIDFAIEDLISTARFKARVEATGNFLFDGKDSDLSRIKNKLYNLEKPSKEISTLGFHKDGFWAWANGLYDGYNFIEIDEHGMVQWNKEHYYIPVFGSTTSVDDDDLRNYRKFQHKQNDMMSFQKWATQFIKVYGDNGRVAIAFYLISIFRDLIQAEVNFTPMLFLFGQRGSGKSEMVKSLMCLFGEAQDPLMLGGASTVVAFMRKLSQFRNTITWFDEYKNDIGEKKIESLKNIWDGVGYERGVKDNSNKTTTSQIRASAILSGQEMPNVEPALFSRVSLLEFKQTQYSQQEINEYNVLKRMQNASLTSITHEVLSHRQTVQVDFKKKFDEVAENFRNIFQGSDVIERQINNHAALVTMVWLLGEKLKLPFTYVDMIKISEKLIPQQSSMMRTANEIQQFWEMVGFLWQNRMITEGLDIQFKDMVTQENNGMMVYTGGLVLIRLATIFPLYRDYARRQGMKALDKGTLIRYFRADGAFAEIESEKSSHRFEKIQNPTSAFVFLHPEMIKLHGINLEEFRPTFKSDMQTVDNQ